MPLHQSLHHTSNHTPRTRTHTPADVQTLLAAEVDDGDLTPGEHVERYLILGGMFDHDRGEVNSTTEVPVMEDGTVESITVDVSETPIDDREAWDTATDKESEWLAANVNAVFGVTTRDSNLARRWPVAVFSLRSRLAVIADRMIEIAARRADPP